MSTPQHGNDAILYNLIYSISTSTALFIAFLILRKKLQWIYSPCVYNDKGHPAVNNNGFFSWSKPTFLLPDPQLLALVGLDAYSYIQSLKMFITTLFLTLMIAAPVLTSLYWSTFNEANEEEGKHRDIVYRCSITSLEPESGLLWIPVVIVYIITLVVFYMIFVFYRNYVLLHQVFVSSPASCVPMAELRRIITELDLNTIESAEQTFSKSTVGRRTSPKDFSLNDDAFGKVYDIINVSTRTVFITGLPHTIKTDADLKAFTSNWYTGNVVDAVIIRNYSRLEVLLQKREDALVNLETACARFYYQILKKKIQKKYSREFGIHSYGAFLQDLINMEEDTIDMDELFELIRSPEFLPDQRLKHSPKLFGKKSSKVDSIDYFFNRIIKLTDKIMKELEKSSQNGSPPVEEEESPNTSPESPGSQLTIFSGENRRSIDDLRMFSLRKFFSCGSHFKKIKKNITLNSKCGFVIFKDPISAEVVGQCLIDSTPFSCNVRKAPSNTDLVWENVAVTETSRSIRKIMCTCISVGIVFFFLLPSFALSAILSADELARVNPYFRDIFKNNPGLHDLLDGILAPLATNILLMIAPYVLSFVTYLEALPSKIWIQKSLLSKYLWFIYIQLFVAILLSTGIWNSLASILNGNYGRIFRDLERSIISKSTFFLNTVIQKAFVELLVVLARPVEILVWALRRLFLENRTPRAKLALREPTKINYGFVYPIVFLPLLISIAYMAVSPLVSLAGLVYYILAYYIYRYVLIFTTVSESEAGGVHWKVISKHMVVAVVTMQILTLIQIAFKKGLYQTVAILLAFTCTLSLYFGIKKLFERRSDFLPLNLDDFAKIEEFGRSVELIQKHFADKWRKDALLNAPEKLKFLLIDEFSLEHCVSSTNPASSVDGKGSDVIPRTSDASQPLMSSSFTPYHNPAIYRKALKLLLPENFFITMNYIRKNGNWRHSQKNQMDDGEII